MKAEILHLEHYVEHLSLSALTSRPPPPFPPLPLPAATLVLWFGLRVEGPVLAGPRSCPLNLHFLPTLSRPEELKQGFGREQDVLAFSLNCSQSIYSFDTRTSTSDTETAGYEDVWGR